ncbi:hypothetical protein TWF506_002097 [Arthrobotrys conoides]|uniref:Peptidase S8/S53 domain-containing protein n=1 Tax=Arthrobotrys conoides TaxID=74498 RepID=A0AAN8RYL6_9PEZI
MTITTGFIFLVYLFYFIINNAHARPWEPAPTYESKLGTLDQYVEIYYAILKKGFRRNKQYKKLLLEWAEHHALEPKKHNIYPAEHESFGLLAVSISVGPDQPAINLREKLPTEIKTGLASYLRIFGDAVQPEGEHFHENPPPWLRSRPATPQSPYLRPKAGLLDVETERRALNPEAVKRNGRLVSRSQVESRIVGEKFTDVQVISQPPGATLDDLQKNSWNFKSPGDGQIVYVMDTGCDLDHPEVKDVRFREDWIFAGAAFPADEKIDSYSVFNHKHGTAVTGRVAGRHTGVAHYAEIVVVKILDGKGASLYDGIIDAWLKVYDDIRKNHPRNCIVNYSSGWLNPPPIQYGNARVLEEFGRIFNELALEILSSIINLENAIIVAPPGNDKPGAQVKAFPAAFGMSTELQDRLVVVGGYNPQSGLLSHNWADYIKIAAPAVGVNIATFYIDGELAVPLPPGYTPQPTKLQKRLQLGPTDGTSYAAPTVAGVIATLLGAGVPLDEVVPYLYSQAYPRARGGPNVVYNGIRIHQWPQSQWPFWYAQSLVTLTEPVATVVRHSIPIKTKYKTFVEEDLRVGTRTISIQGLARKTLYTTYAFWKRGTRPTPSTTTKAR